MTSFSIQNFGCRVNQAEAFEWSADLERRGFCLRTDGRAAVVVVNTCTLTSRADRDARKFIRRVVRENPRAKVVVTGCLAERDPAGLRALPGVRRVLGNSEKAGIPEAVLAAADLARPSVSSKAPDGSWLGSPPSILAEAAGGRGAPEPSTRRAKSRPFSSFRSRALLKVQDGCDMSCRFCIIPRVRGRGRSAALGGVLDRIRRLAAEGFAEVVLTGIHLASYGTDLRPRSTLLDLVESVEMLPGDFRIRLSSLDPRFLTPALVGALTRPGRISPHFHLSFQHGSDRILRAMGRGSTAAEYRFLLQEFSARSPEAALGADFIVGFPGETEDDFEATAALVRDAPLDYAHVFSYSPRPGTPAADDPPVGEAVKKARAARLRLLAEGKNVAFRRRFEGRILDGIVVRTTPAGGKVLTSNYIDVAVPPNPAPPRKAVRVRISGISGRETAGEIVEDRFPESHG